MILSASVTDIDIVTDVVTVSVIGMGISIGIVIVMC